MRQMQRIRTWSTSPIALAVLVGLGGLVLYGTQLTTLEMNGDAALYAFQVARLNLRELTLHTGFLALGIVFDRLLPGPTTLALNTMSALFGSLGAGLVAWLTWRLTSSRAAEVVAGLSLLLASNYWTHALYAEVYVVQTCLVLLAWVNWIKGQGVWAGMAFLAAMLVSPLSILTLPALLMINRRESGPVRMQMAGFLGLCRQLWRQVGAFGLAWIPIYSLFVWLNRYEYFHRHTFIAGSWRYDLPYSLAFLGFSFLTIWPWVALGVFSALSKSSSHHRLLLVGISLTFIAHVLVVGKLSDHGAFFLPFYPLVAVLAGLGVQSWSARHIGLTRERLPWIGAIGGLGLLVIIGGKAFTLPLFAQHARRYLSEFETSLSWLYLATALIAITGWKVVRRLGIERRQATIRTLIGLALAWQGITGQALMVSPQHQQAERIKQIATELEAYRSDNSLLIATWSQGALYEYYTTGQVARQGWWEIKQEVTAQRLQAAIRQYDQVWLIHPYSPALLQENGISPDDYLLQEVHLSGGIVWQIKGK